jgi:CheY-like chemotaxis protein
MLQVCIEYLASMGNTVVVAAENGAKAVASFEYALECGQPFDVVLMDVMMPVMDGLAATGRIRDIESSHIAQGTASAALIVAITTLHGASDQERCIRAGMNACLTKPLAPTALSRVIATALHQRGNAPETPRQPATLDAIEISERIGIGEPSSSTESLGPCAFPAMQSTPLEEAGGSTHGSRDRTLRCLVADDNFFNREVAATLLTAIGHNVSQSQDGAEAVASFEHALERGEPFDVVIIDVMMPVMDGLAATGRIRDIEARNRGSGAPRALVLAVTASAPGEVQQTKSSEGVDRVIAKPLSAKTLQGVFAEAFALGPTTSRQDYE